MAAPKLLIVGRGPVAILAARLAMVRGYEPTLLVDSSPDWPTLFLGGREGVVSLLEEQSGCHLGAEEASTDPALPLLLYMGDVHRLVGCRLTVPASPEEEGRFFPDLSTLQTSLSPELDRGILLSIRKTSFRASLGQRLFDWFLEPEREKETLARSYRKVVAQILPHWKTILEDVAPFAGLAERRPEDPERFRLLSNFTEGRGRILSGFPGPAESVVDLPGVEVMAAGAEPVVLEWKKRGRSVTIEGQKDRYFDKVLSLTAAPSLPLLDAMCDIDSEKLSPLWPGCVLLKSDQGEPSFLTFPSAEGAGGKRVVRISAPRTGEGDMRAVMTQWVDRWNAESLFPFLRPESLILREIRPLVVFPSGTDPFPREVTPLLSVEGHYAEMVDPTRIPVVSEDFWADLSMAIPSLTSLRRE